MTQSDGEARAPHPAHSDLAAWGPRAGYLIILLLFVTSEVCKWVVPTRQLGDRGKGVAKREQEGGSAGC